MAVLTGARAHVFLLKLLTIFCFQAAFNCISIDKLLLAGSEGPNVMEFQFDEASGVYSFDLDLLFTKSQWKQLQDRNHTRWPGYRGKRKGTLVADLWPNAVVPYEISKYYEPEDTRTVKEAIANWEEHTCVRFRPANSRDRHKVIFTVSSACKSFVGMDKQGPQNMYLSEDCRQMEGVITHELGHVLGLYHEQSRPDRDDYVTINWDKISDMAKRNFELFSSNVVSSFGVPYDYKSIMHYGATAFSPDDEYTIIPKDYRFINVIGNREGLSFRDIKIINVMYECGARCPGKCPGEGFHHHETCECVCPGNPLQPCSQGGREPDAGGQLPPDWKLSEGGKEINPCVDDNAECTNWAAGMQCTKNPDFMDKYCRKSCGICGDSKKPECKDANTVCNQWARAGECDRNPTYMKSYCRMACGVCGGAAARPTQPPCRDVDRRCPAWANYGYCTAPANAGFMSNQCKKSCNLCGSGGGNYADDPNSSCRDSTPSCAGWASVGECESNPAYMLANCKKSCKVCSSSTPSAGGNERPPDMLADDPNAGGVKECHDKNPSCGGWAADGECASNPAYMMVNCKWSCREC